MTTLSSAEVRAWAESQNGDDIPPSASNYLQVAIHRAIYANRPVPQSAWDAAVLNNPSAVDHYRWAGVPFGGVRVVPDWRSWCTWHGSDGTCVLHRACACCGAPPVLVGQPAYCMAHADWNMQEGRWYPAPAKGVIR